MSKGLTANMPYCRISSISLFYLTPTLLAKLPSWWGGILPKDKIHLGLDLQGGIHLVMQVETQKAVEGALDIIATDLEDTMNDKNIRFKSSSRVGSDGVAVVLYDKATADAVQKLMKEKYPHMEMLPAGGEGGYFSLQMRLGAEEAKKIRDFGFGSAGARNHPQPH
jgi:preprotein translocase subunit SecD